MRTAFLTAALAAVTMTAIPATAQSTYRGANQEYRGEIRDAQRDYRKDVRNADSRKDLRDARKDYRKDVRDAQKDRRQDRREITRDYRQYRNYDYTVANRVRELIMPIAIIATAAITRPDVSGGTTGSIVARTGAIIAAAATARPA